MKYPHTTDRNQQCGGVVQAESEGSFFSRRQRIDETLQLLSVHDALHSVS